LRNYGGLPATQALQRSIHDAPGEGYIDAAEGDAVPTIRDVMNAVEALDVDSERTQARKDAGTAADAAGILAEAAVADVVDAVLNVPVVTDGLGTKGVS